VVMIVGCIVVEVYCCMGYGSDEGVWKVLVWLVW